MRIHSVIAAAIVLAASQGHAEADAAVMLGPGTTFTSLVPVAAPAGRTLYLSEGDALPQLREPVGSCRLHFKPGIRELEPGQTFHVRSVSTSTSPHQDHGISTVHWGFAAADPVDTMVCDTVGSPGPSEYDVRWSTQGIFSIAPAMQLSDR